MSSPEDEGWRGSLADLQPAFFDPPQPVPRPTEPMDVVQVVVPVELIPYLTACLKIRHIELYGPVPLPGAEDELPTYFTRPDAEAMEASR